MAPVRAALLSFVVPGFGQWAVGRWLRGLLFVLPHLGLVALVGLAVAVPRAELLGALVRSETIVALLVLDALLFFQRLVAVVDAYLAAGGRRSASSRIVRATSLTALTVLVAISGLVHGALGYLGLRAYGTLDAVFVGDAGWQVPEYPPSAPPSSSPSPSPSPSPRPSAGPSPLALRFPRADRLPRSHPLRLRPRRRRVPFPAGPPTAVSTSSSSAPTPDRTAGACERTPSSSCPSTSPPATPPSSASLGISSACPSRRRVPLPSRTAASRAS
ncbi:MAG: hypothetical protein KatS3mg065_1093 [Chloroflexota bacterium]|nr:MAG: hypothetical protein KatS3mg065_1093 [Chloroflexota bacterium]